MFDYALSLSAKTLREGEVLELSLDGRSMFLLEGTASGPFVMTLSSNVQNQYEHLTVTPDEHGEFSVLLPVSSWYRFHEEVNARNDVANPALLTVTRFPDCFDTCTLISGMFANCHELTSVADMGFVGRATRTDAINEMFLNCRSLVHAPWMDTSDKIIFQYAFRGCTSMVDVPLYDTGKARNFNGVFYGCSSLTSVPEFDTSSVTDMSTAFYGCSSVTSFPFFDTRNVTRFYQTFYNCRSITSIPLFDTSKATTMLGMFCGCSSLKSSPAFDTSSCTNFDTVFADCSSLETIPWFDLSKVTTMDRSFSGCSSLCAIPEGLDTSNCTNFYITFGGCSSLTEMPWLDTSKGTTFHQFMFGCSGIEHLPDFDLSSAVVLSSAFYRMSSLKEVPASFRFSSATTMNSCFDGCTSLREVLCPLDFPAATTLESVFPDILTIETFPSVVNAPEAKSMRRFLWGTSLAGKSLTVNAPKITNYEGAFFHTSLASITGINFGVVEKLDYTFDNTFITSLTDVDLSSITSTLDLGTTPYLTEFIGTFTGPSCSLKLSGTNLSHESLVKVLEGLPSVSTTQTLTLGSTLLSRLSSSEISIATGKGWTVL